MLLKMVFIIMAIIYACFNAMLAACFNAREMKTDLIDEQCAIGRLFANLFYAPAWILKGIRFVVTRTIK